MRRNKKQRRERIYEMRNLRKKITQNEQYTARHTAAVMINKIKWKWWWTERITETETTIIIITTITAAAAAANWVKKSLCLNRISKRIRTEIKSIYNEATHLFNMCFIKKKINKQKAATNRFRLQFICDRSFAVQWIHKI